MQTTDMRRIVGRDLRDRELHKVGTVTDAIYDDQTLQLRWVVVRFGFARHRVLVPAAKIYRSDAGDVITEIDKDLVHNAPRLHGQLPNTTEAAAYYGADAA